MKRIFIISMLPFLLFSGYAQENKLSVKSSVLGYSMGLYPASVSNINWKDETSFYYLDKGKVYLQTVKAEEPKEVLNTLLLNSILRGQGGDTLRSLSSIQWIGQNLCCFYSPASIVFFQMDSLKVKSVFNFPDGAANFDVHPKKTSVAFTISNNVYVWTNNEIIKISNETDPGIVCGQEVSRNEFGCSKGTFWSADGRFLAFYRKDERGVTNYPLVNIDKRIAAVENTKYPMAGMKSQNLSLGIYDLDKKSRVFIEANDTVSEKYLTMVSWSPDSKSIYIGVLNREQNHLKLNNYDVVSGNLLTTLFEEKHPKYVEPIFPLSFIPGDPSRFIYHSKRDGYNHLYLYNSNGKLEKQLTSGKWEVTELLGFDKKGQDLYFMSTQNGPLNRVCARLDMKTWKNVVISEREGIHSIHLSPESKYFIDAYSSLTIPFKLELRQSDGKFLKTLKESENPLTDYHLPMHRIGTLTSADGTTPLYYHIIYPAGFDSTMKYPTVVYLYGGPHNQMVSNDWLAGISLWQYFMAQEGYVMFTIDNRGSEGRGFDFENIIHRNCGVNEAADQYEGVKYLKSLSFVDTTRMGIHGWSYGGFMTITMMTRYPDVFKAGVAGGPVIDWNLYEIMYGERYMDTPQENPEGYAAASLLDKAANLKGDLLIVHGAQDPTVVWQNSLLFVQECINKQVQVDYFVYPHAEHNMHGWERVHLMEKVSRYFNDKLK